MFFALAQVGSLRFTQCQLSRAPANARATEVASELDALNHGAVFALRLVELMAAHSSMATEKLSHVCGSRVRVRVIVGHGLAWCESWREISIAALQRYTLHCLHEPVVDHHVVLLGSVCCLRAMSEEQDGTAAAKAKPGRLTPKAMPRRGSIARVLNKAEPPPPPPPPEQDDAMGDESIPAATTNRAALTASCRTS